MDIASCCNLRAIFDWLLPLPLLLTYHIISHLASTVYNAYLVVKASLSYIPKNDVSLGSVIAWACGLPLFLAFHVTLLGVKAILDSLLDKMISPSSPDVTSAPSKPTGSQRSACSPQKAEQYDWSLILKPALSSPLEVAHSSFLELVSPISAPAAGSFAARRIVPDTASLATFEPASDTASFASPKSAPVAASFGLFEPASDAASFASPKSAPVGASFASPQSITFHSPSPLSAFSTCYNDLYGEPDPDDMPPYIYSNNSSSSSGSYHWDGYQIFRNVVFESVGPLPTSPYGRTSMLYCCSQQPPHQEQQQPEQELVRYHPEHWEEAWQPPPAGQPPTAKLSPFAEQPTAVQRSEQLPTAEQLTPTERPPTVQQSPLQQVREQEAAQLTEAVQQQQHDQQQERRWQQQKELQREEQLPELPEGEVVTLCMRKMGRHEGDETGT